MNFTCCFWTPERPLHSTPLHSAPGQEILEKHDNEFNKEHVRMTSNKRPGVQEEESEQSSCKRRKLNLLEMPPSLKTIQELKAMHNDTVTIDAGQAVLVAANKGSELYAYAEAAPSPLRGSTWRFR